MAQAYLPWVAWFVACAGLGGALAMAACEPAIALGTASPGSGGGTTGATTTSASTGTVTTGGVLVSCSTPAGTAQVLGSLDDVYAMLEGDWWLCPPTFPAAPSDAIGIRFAPGSSARDGGTEGGLAYFLVQGPTQPEPGAGFAYQLTYDVSILEGSVFQLTFDAVGGSWFGPITYSSSPKELEVDFDFAPFQALLVTL